MVAMSEQTSTVQGRARATNVNLNIPARQAVQKINVPERSRGELDVDVNKIFKGVVDGIEDYQEKKVEKGLNNYAREVNKIAEGVRQGAFGADAAEGKLRQLDDTYLAQGYKAEELGTIRAKYDGGVYTARSAVLKEKETHEAKRRLEVADTFRKTYQFSSQWSDERVLTFVDGINRVHDELVATNKALESPNMSAEDREALTRVRNDQFERLGMENTMMQLNLRLENNQPLTAEEVAMFRQNFMAEARRNQIPLEVAAVMSDRMLDASGMSTIMELQKQNADNITEYNKKITGAMIESSRLGQYRSFPQLVTLDAMSAEARKAYLETPEGDNLLRIIGTSLVGTYNNETKSLELPATNTVPVLMDVVTNATRQPSQYPSTVLSNGISLTTNTLGQYNQDVLNNMSTPSDVKTIHYNMEALRNKYHNNPNVLKVVETMSPEQQEQFEKSGRFNMAISEWTALMPDFVLDAKKMFNSLGTSRLRVNDEGLLVMTDDVTGSAKGFWQTAGNILGAFHSDIDEHIAGVNEFLSANLESPEERKEFIKMISGGNDIPNAGTSEVTEDNYRSVTGNIGDIVSSVAKGAWEADKTALNNYANFNQKLGAAVNESINKITNNSVNSTVGELTGFGKESKKKPLIDMKKVTDVANELFGIKDAGAAVKILENEPTIMEKFNAEESLYNMYDRHIRELRQREQDTGENWGREISDLENSKQSLGNPYGNMYRRVSEFLERTYGYPEYKKHIKKENKPAKEYTSSFISPMTYDGADLYAGLSKPARRIYNKIDDMQFNEEATSREAEILKAMVFAESSDGTLLESSMGARGPLQFMPETWRTKIMPELGFTEEDIDDFDKNIEAGLHYFRYLMGRFGNDEEKAIAAYNLGETKLRAIIRKHGKEWRRFLFDPKTGDEYETKEHLKKINRKLKNRWVDDEEEYARMFENNE